MVDYLTGLATVLKMSHPLFDYHVRSAVNRDGSVDAEALIKGLRTGDWEKFFKNDPETGRVIVLDNLPAASDLWIATFILFDPENYEGPYDLQTLYEVYRNEIDIATLYYPIRPAYLVNMILAVQNILDGTEEFKTSKKKIPKVIGFIEKYGVHPSGFQIRISWNPKNVRPDMYRGLGS
jgi:hypothetical protein